MLPIIHKMQRCYKECESLISRLEQISYELQDCMAPGVKLNKKVGIIVQEMVRDQKETANGKKKYAVLADDVSKLIEGLRRVCTGEISISKAQEQVNEAIHKLEAIKRGLTEMEKALKGEKMPKVELKLEKEEKIEP